MSSSHMLDFDTTVELILEAVYRDFPKLVKVDINSIGLSSQKPAYNEFGTSQNSQEWLDMNEGVNQTRRWLRDEGFLREDVDSFGALYTLTCKGLKCLNNLKGEAALLPRLLRD